MLHGARTSRWCSFQNKKKISLFFGVDPGLGGPDVYKPTFAKPWQSLKRYFKTKWTHTLFFLTLPPNTKPTPRTVSLFSLERQHETVKKIISLNICQVGTFLPYPKRESLKNHSFQPPVITIKRKNGIWIARVDRIKFKSKEWTIGSKVRYADGSGRRWWCWRTVHR